MNRRDVLIATALAPSAVTAQEQTCRSALDKAMGVMIAREARLYDRLLEVWEWLDIWGDMLPDGARADLLKSLGPDPGVRIAR